MEYLNLLLYRISVVSFIFIFAFGCGDSDKPTAKASRSINADIEIVVGVTLMTTSNPFFVILGEAAKKEAAEHDLLIKEQNSTDEKWVLQKMFEKFDLKQDVKNLKSHIST